MYVRIHQHTALYKSLNILLCLAGFMLCFTGNSHADQEKIVSTSTPLTIHHIALAEDKVAFLRQLSFSVTATPGTAGEKAYQIATDEMAELSPEGESLPPEMKELLTLFFDETLVNSIHLHWNADLPEKWAYAGYSITLKNIDTEAQTYGYDIYIKYSQSELDTLALATLLIHHMTHVRQFKQLGESIPAFGYHYFVEYWKTGNFFENDMEEEADANVGRFLNSVYAIR